MTNVPRLVLTALACTFFAVVPAGGTLTGPVYPPPLGVSFSQSGSQGDTEIGRSSGKTWYMSNVLLASATDVYWGADNSGVALSMRQQPFQSYEYCTYRPDLSNLPGGIVVWTGASYVPAGTWVATKFTLTVRDSSSNSVALSNAASLGLSENLGGLVKVTPGLSFSANLKFEATYSSSNTGWTPALDLFDAWCFANTSGPVSTYATYTSYLAGFYYRDPMGVQPSSLAFTGQVYSAIEPQTLAITNSGSVPLTYTVASDNFWLSPDAPNGTLAVGAGTTVVARVATRGLAPRTYTGRLTVSDTSGARAPLSVPVSLSLSAVSPPSRVLAWGHNGYGQANVPANLTNAVAVAAGTYHSLALRANGTLTAWGSNNYGELSQPLGLPNVTAVAAGYCDTLVLFANGTLYPCGFNGYGAISGMPSGISNAVAVAAGEYHLLALRADGTVAAWGWNDYGQTNVTPGLSNAVAVSGGYLHSMALRANGTVTVWGFNSDGQLNVPANLTNAVAVAAGKFHSLALKADGTVAAWGSGAYGASTVPPGLSNVVSISAGWNSSQALRADGTVVAWGCNDYGQRNVPLELTNAVALTSGYYYSLALAPANALVVSSPYGSPVPGRGTNWLIRNTWQALSVEAQVTSGSMQYVCTGWVGSGSVPSSGTSNYVSVLLGDNSSIAWLWQTNYAIAVSAGDHGSIAPSGTVYVPYGSDRAFMITPEAYYHIGAVRTNGVLAGANLGESPYPFTLRDVVDAGTLHVTFAENLAPLGTPEHWLARYGTTTGGVTFAQAETTNHDGDPFDTWKEYVADTDPTNSASYFYIEGVSNTACRAVYFLSSPNRIYTLNAKTNLLQELWQPVPERSSISGNGGRLTLTDPETTATSIFYRVRVQLP